MSSTGYDGHIDLVEVRIGAKPSIEVLEICHAGAHAITVSEPGLLQACTCRVFVIHSPSTLRPDGIDLNPLVHSVTVRMAARVQGNRPG